MIETERLHLRPLIYHFVPEAWGRGYATEAVQATLAWARLQLTATYVEASFDPENTASKGVLVKAGFAFREDCWFEDVQRTELVYRYDLWRPE